MFTKRLFVTSFNESLYNLYGRAFLDQFVRLWPQDERLIVFTENVTPDISDPRITYLDLLADKELLRFLSNYAQDPRVQGNKDYRFQAVRFGYKVFSYTSPIVSISDWRIWIDADVVTESKIDPGFFAKNITGHELAHYIGREHSWDHSEAGFLAFNMNHRSARPFLSDIRALYTTGSLFDQKQWHDSYLFDIVRKRYQAKGHQFKDIAKDINEEHPWDRTWLGQYLHHMKGPQRKLEAYEGEKLINLSQLVEGCRDRYEQLERVIHFFKPRTLLEVGTHRGERAIAMALEALKVVDKVHYTGFDLFDAATDEVNRCEFNAKGTAHIKDTAEALDAFGRDHPGFTFELIPGNSRETLKSFRPDKAYDLAFIDGGHSVETVKSDLEHLLPITKAIVLDDYYLAGVDTDRFGCNKVVEEHKHVILPVVDQYGEQKIAMAMVGALVPGNERKSKLQMKTRNCAPDESIQANIRYASRFDVSAAHAEIERVERDIPVIEGLKHLKGVRFIDKACKPHDDLLVLVSAGDAIRFEDHPNHVETWRALSEHYAAGDKIVGNKTNHDLLISRGIIPWGVVLLDPRDHVASKFTVDSRVIYFVASMCHRSTWDRLLALKAKVVGYHAAVGAQEGPIIAAEFGNKHLSVAGGTSSVMRSFFIFYILGFRNFRTYALDSNYWKRPDRPHGRSDKEFMEVEVGGRKFTTDGEMMAQAQDAEHLLKTLNNCNISFHGEGMLQHAMNLFRDMWPRVRGEGAVTNVALGPWTTSLKNGDPELELIFIDSAIASIVHRKEYLENSVELTDYKTLLPG